MNRLMILCFCTCLFVMGCGESSNKKKLTEVQVSGKVTLDSKPLVEGEITFVLDGSNPLVIPIKDGVFSGKAYAGNNRVEVRAYKAGPPLTTDPEKKPTKINFIPTRYNDQSKSMKDIPAAGASEIVVDVKSK